MGDQFSVGLAEGSTYIVSFQSESICQSQRFGLWDPLYSMHSFIIANPICTGELLRFVAARLLTEPGHVQLLLFRDMLLCEITSFKFKRLRLEATSILPIMGGRRRS